MGFLPSFLEEESKVGAISRRFDNDSKKLPGPQPASWLAFKLWCVLGVVAHLPPV